MKKKPAVKPKNQPGSALVMVLLIVTIMTTIGIAVMMLSLSDYTMSTMYGDRNKAYLAAEAAQGLAGRALDLKVMEAQEAARIETNAYIDQLMTPVETSPLRNSDGSVNQAAVDMLFKSKYLEYFNAKIASPMGFFTNIGQPANLNYLAGVDAGAAQAAAQIDGDPTAAGSQAVILAAALSGSTVTVRTAGKYTDSQKHTYTREIEAGYSLLPDPDKLVYQAVPRVAIKQASLPAVLEKALLAEKNIIAAGGTVNVTGDVLAFGTIPVKNGAEDPDAPGYKYGGIMAGIPDVSGLNMNGSGMDFGTYFDFSTARTGTRITGKINILQDLANGVQGNAATMGYLHTLYGIANTDFSGIITQGKAYARSVKAEEAANYSAITLQDVFTTDNLQIDASESIVNVQGKYYGLVTAGYDIDGSGNQTMTGNGEYQYKKTSSIVVNGDSTLYLNGTSGGGVYIGGSTFLRNYLDSSYYPAEYRPYMTGISALRSSSRLAEAFKQYNALNGETRLYTGNGQYTTNPGTAAYTNITDPASPAPTSMLNGTSGSFTVANRSSHFKWLWEGLWKLDDIYQRYTNPSSIQVSVDSDNKIQGFAFGDVVANGSVFGQTDFKGLVDATNFGLMQRGTTGSTGWLQEFHNQIQPLLTETYSATAPKLDYVANSKHIADYIDPTKTGAYASPVLAYAGGQPQGIVYVKYGDCNIANSGAGWTVDGYALPDTKGLIIATGNIYVANGFSFSGALLSAKNVVFLGNANVIYDRTVLQNLMVDPGVAGLFRASSAIGDATVKGQRTSYQNIKVIQWKQVK